MKKIRKWKKEFPRILAAVLAAVLLATMPGTASAAVAEETVLADGNPETEIATEQTGSDADSAETETDVLQEPAEEAAPPKEDEKSCDCGILCTQDSINGDCPVCGAEGADLSVCEGKEIDGENTEIVETEDMEEDVNLCVHHKEHTGDCGYIPVSEDGEGSPCVYECRICPIEDLIAALPDKVTEDNRSEVWTQLNEILSLYRGLTEAEQEQVDISRCLELQAELDALEGNEGEHDPVPAPEAVSYRVCDSDGKNWTTGTVSEYTEITAENASASWIGGWYVVTGDVAISGRVTVSGEVHLILADGCSLTTGGITVEPDNSLSVYAQEDGTGSLTANGSEDAAGIGGSARGKNGGTITIYGGHITAQGGNNGSGIGSGNVASGGTIAIHGGNVEATGGGYYGAGIGGYNADGTTILITGGTVTAKSYFSSNETKGDLTITGGILNGEGGCTVTFMTSDQSVAIPNQTISEGKKAVQPEIEGWILTFFTDTGYTIPFDFGMAISESITIYVHCEKNTDYIATVNGTNYTSVTGFTDAIKKASGEVTATLLKDVDLGDTGRDPGLTVPSGVTLTLDCGEFTLTGSGAQTIWVNGTLNFTGGTIYNTEERGSAIYIFNNGKFRMSGGEVVNMSAEMKAVGTVLQSTVTILGGTIGGGGLGLTYTPAGGDKATLSGGTYSILQAGYYSDGNTSGFRTISEILAPGYALRGENGLIGGTATGRQKNVTVVECTHPGQTADLGNGTHGAAGEGSTCIYCGTTITPKPHTLDADNVCSDCGVKMVAQVESGGDITYYGSIETAWTSAKGKTATITLLDNVETREALEISGSDAITFDGGAYTLTIKLATANAYAITVNGGKLTIQSGTITAKGIVSNCVKAAGGTFVFTGGKVEAADNGINAAGGTVQISGGETSGGTGLFYNGDGSVRISGGTFNGTSHAVYHYTGKVSGLLDHTDITRYAYYQGEVPVTEGLESKSLPKGTYTVKECRHDTAGVKQYRHNDGTETHTLTCLACGYTEAVENCSYSFSGNVGTCPDCQDALTVSVTGMDSLTYDGNEKKPDVTVMRGGTALDAAKYTVAYNGNKDAGTNTASVTVIIGSSQGTYNERFSIGRAMLTITASDQTVTYGQSIQQGVAQVTVSGLCGDDTLSGVTITPSSNQVTVENKTVAPSAAKIMNSGGQNVTANYDITYVPGKLTIGRAAGTLTVPENTISKTYGDGEFSLNCSTNGDGKITYVSSNKDVASVSADGNLLITGVGKTVITVTLAEGVNYTGGARQEITVTVAKAAAPAIMGETRNYTYTNGSNGAVTIDVAGKLPKDRGRTEYTVTITNEKGILSDVSVDGNGNLVYTVLGNRSEGDTASVTVTAEMANYEPAAFTVDIELVKKKAVEPQAGGSVSISGSNTLIYGQMLSDLTLSSVTFVEQGTGKKVEGTLAWKNSSFTPAAGTTGAEWVFTPANSSEYAEMTGTVPVTVAKATPDADAPTADAVTYDPSGKLSSVTLTGGSAAWTVGGRRVDVEGTWSWKDGSISPAVGNRGYMAVFTPKDTDNYNTVEREITVTVGRAAPYIEGKVSAAPITYGDSLNASALTGMAQYSSSDGTVVPGSFTWKDGTVKPAVSDSDSTKYTVIFTPDEGTNYSSVETEITLVVKKAENAPNKPSGAMNVPRRCEKVNDVELPSGWQWHTADREKELEIDVPLSATAIYVGTDKDNYENTEVTITITRSNCDHEKTELKDVLPATCEKEGYSGDTWCTVCRELLQKGSVTPTIDHKGGVASCREQAVCEMCKKPYGIYDAKRHINTERRNAAPASCTTAGNTGDLYCTACGAKVESGRVIPASGHDWQESVVRQPTTSEEGLRRYICRNCGASREEAIPKLPSEAHTHSYSMTETKAASCTGAGIKVYSCSCGDSYTESTPASGHSYHSQMTKAPTVSEEGVMTYTCTRCGHSYTAAISRLEAPAPGQTPGTGTGNTVKTGTGSTENPGDRTGAAQEGRPDTGIPFIKDADGKTGWDIIRAEEEKARDGNVINVDMNGSVVVPGDIFDNIKGRDITITFDMGNGILWSVDGKSITTDKAGDIDFSVKTGVSAVPVDIVNNVTGENYSIQISLAYEGEFGFTAVLSIGLGEENAGYIASLYYYNESTGELEFICADEVAEDGTAELAFTHASDYVITIDRDEEESGGITETAEPEGSGGTEDNVPPESPRTMQGRKSVLWPAMAGILALAVIVFAGMSVWKKKKEKDSGTERDK